MKQLSSNMLKALVFLMLGMLTTSGLWGQGITSSALSGRIIDSEGNAVEGATVTAVHTPTGTVYSMDSRANGRYNFANIRVGGPYTVSASAAGMRDASEAGVFTSLGQTTDVSLRLAIDTGEVIELEEFTVEARSGDYLFDPNNMGVSTSYGAADIAGTPSTRRHFNDVARLNPFVTLTEEDRNEQEASASRYEYALSG